MVSYCIKKVDINEPYLAKIYEEKRRLAWVASSLVGEKAERLSMKMYPLKKKRIFENNV